MMWTLHSDHLAHRLRSSAKVDAVSFAVLLFAVLWVTPLKNVSHKLFLFPYLTSDFKMAMFD